MDAATDVAINGYKDIEREIFSLTAYEEAPDFDTGAGPCGLEFCKEYGIESIGFPGNLGWTIAGDWWAGMTREEIVDYCDKGHASNNFFKYGESGPDWQSYYVDGRILPALRSVGVNGFMYVDGPEPPFTGCHASDDAVRRWIDVSTRWIRLCLEADPELQYFHFYGEPNARWFKHGLGADDYEKFFKVWAKATKMTFPKIQLGGPVSWGAPTRDVGWDGWCKNLIDISHEELDFLDWHDYGSLSAKLEGDGLGECVQLPKNRAASGAWSGLTRLRVAV